MARSVSITVHPWTEKSENLSVTDALRHVLDFVEILERLEDPVDSKRRINWKLTTAHANSPPLTVGAQAFPNKANMSIEPQATKVTNRALDLVKSVANGRMPVGLESGSSDALRRMLDRNVRIIGRTEIRLDDHKPIAIVPKTAQAASRAIDQASAER